MFDAKPNFTAKLTRIFSLTLVRGRSHSWRQLYGLCRKKSFLRLLHFMGGDSIGSPLSLAWLHFRCCVGHGVSTMHVVGRPASFLFLSQKERTDLCRLINSSVYLFVHTGTWPAFCLSGGDALLLCNWFFSRCLDFYLVLTSVLRAGRGKLSKLLEVLVYSCAALHCFLRCTEPTFSLLFPGWGMLGMSKRRELVLMSPKPNCIGGWGGVCVYPLFEFWALGFEVSSSHFTINGNGQGRNARTWNNWIWGGEKMSFRLNWRSQCQKNPSGRLKASATCEKHWLWELLLPMVRGTGDVFLTGALHWTSSVPLLSQASFVLEILSEIQIWFVRRMFVSEQGPGPEEFTSTAWVPLLCICLKRPYGQVSALHAKWGIRELSEFLLKLVGCLFFQQRENTQGSHLWTRPPCFSSRTSAKCVLLSPLQIPYPYSALQCHTCAHRYPSSYAFCAKLSSGLIVHNCSFYQELHPRSFLGHPSC